MTVVASVADCRCLQRVEILNKWRSLAFYAGRPSLPPAGRHPRQLKVLDFLRLYGGLPLPPVVRNPQELNVLDFLSLYGGPKMARMTPDGPKTAHIAKDIPKIAPNGQEPWQRALTDSPSTHPRDSIAIPASLMRGDIRGTPCGVQGAVSLHPGARFLAGVVGGWFAMGGPDKSIRPPMVGGWLWLVGARAR